jgi:adenylate cyclase
MPPERLKRKLAAILSADVKDYSRLMENDEEATVATLKRYREIFARLIQQYRGRVVDSPGDNLLAEFPSVVDAVECAVDIQKALRSENVELQGPRRMAFRIGINLGDVILDEERIYGDGVNIAARMENLAEGGGICISGTVFDNIENKVNLSFQYLGEQAVKNISKPVRAYKVLFESNAAITEDAEKLDMPDKPSIAVLPFTNMSGDPEQEYFSDGITEDLITDLSKISGLFVIARNSVFTYKGKAVKVQDVSRELGVRYVLEGSVRKAGDRVRITSQLVEATTGGHLWAERYDRELKDIFALQDDVTQQIVTALAVQLTDEEWKRLARKGTENIDAYDYVLRGMEYLYRFTKEANTEGRSMLQKAVQQDSRYAFAYSQVGRSYMNEWSFGWSGDPATMDRAFDLAQQAISLDKSEPNAHALLSEVFLWRKQYDQSIEEIEKVIQVAPNNADALASLAGVLCWAGNPEEAISIVNRAMQLNPFSPVWYEWNLGHAYFLTERLEKAITTHRKVIDRNPNFLPSYAYLAASYIELGREEEALIEAAGLERLSPYTALEDWKKRLPYKDPKVLERLCDDLKKAGFE